MATAAPSNTMSAAISTHGHGQGNGNNIQMTINPQGHSPTNNVNTPDTLAAKSVPSRIVSLMKFLNTEGIFSYIVVIIFGIPGAIWARQSLQASKTSNFLAEIGICSSVPVRYHLPVLREHACIHVSIILTLVEFRCMQTHLIVSVFFRRLC